MALEQLGRVRIQGLLVVLCLASCLGCSNAAQDECAGPLVELLVAPAPFNASAAPQQHFGVLAAFGGKPSSNGSVPVRLAVATPRHACAPLSNVAGAAVLIERGNCSFIDKFAAVLAAGGTAMLMYDNVPGCIGMGGNASALANATLPPGAPNASTVPAISIDRAVGLTLVQQATTGDGASLSMKLLVVPAFDPSAIVLWLMAVGTVVGGSLWAGADHILECRVVAAGDLDGYGRAGSSGEEVVEITAMGAVCFVGAASVMLLVFFFFMNQVLFVVLSVGFALAAAQAVVAWLAPVMALCLPKASQARNLQLPCLGEVAMPSLLALPFALALAITWLVWRHAAWAWVLQDVLGISLMLLILRTLRLSSLRVACILLPLCFAYDVWWVFLQPLVFGDGTSVMVEVAEGAGTAEALPMLLRMPRLAQPAVGGYSMLGFGDVILPGLLVALCRRRDIDAAAAGRQQEQRRVKRGGCGDSRGWLAAVFGAQGLGGYFVPVCCGYASGLLLTYVALVFSWFGDQGQPALLYLVPCTLGLVLLLAWVRGDLARLFDAEHAAQGEHSSGGDSAGLGSALEDGEDVRLLVSAEDGTGVVVVPELGVGSVSGGAAETMQQTQAAQQVSMVARLLPHASSQQRQPGRSRPQSADGDSSV